MDIFSCIANHRELYSYMFTCSTWCWILNFLQIPISISVTLYEAIGIYRGDKVITSRGVRGLNLKVSQLLVYCSSEIVGGIVGGLLGLGGGFILGPLFLELGIPRQVSSATATFCHDFLVIHVCR